MMLTRKEYMKEAGPFGFCLHPLDVNIAKMQQKLQKQVEPWEEEQEHSVTEHWVSRNPEMSISKVSITALQTTECCKVAVRVTDKRLKYIAKRPVWIGTLNELKYLLDSYKFLIYCKRELLWLNYALENYTEEQELLDSGWQPSKEVYTDNDAIFEQLSRIVIQWDEVVPKQDDFTTVYDIIDNNDIFSQNVISAYGLKISSKPTDETSEVGKCYIEALAYDASGCFKASMMVMFGSRDEVKESIQNTGFSYSMNGFFYKVFDAYTRLYEALRND